jgi:hypothetical protein
MHRQPSTPSPLCPLALPIHPSITQRKKSAPDTRNARTFEKKPEALHFAPNPTLDFLSIEKLPEEKTQQRKKNGPK